MKKYFLKALLILGAVFFVMPLTSNAMTAVCSGTSSDPADVVTTFDPPSNPPEGMTSEEDVTSLIYTAATGTATYNVECTVSDDTELASAPMLMAAGFNMNHDSYLVHQLTATSYYYSFTGVSGDFYIPEQDEIPDPEMVFVFIATAADPSLSNPVPSNGPPASMGGGYISTTVQDFQIVPPTDPSDPAIGVTLTGPASISGFFKMYLPPTMLTLMGTMSGKTMTAADMAVFVDDSQASMSITETSSGGALIDININFTEGNTATASSIASTTDVTKEIVTKEKLPLSAAFKKATISKNKTARLYGWKSENYTNKTAKIYKKKKGATSYTLVKTVDLDNVGYYKYNFTAKNKGTYYYKVKSAGLTSEKLTLVVQ